MTQISRLHSFRRQIRADPDSYCSTFDPLTKIGQRHTACWHEVRLWHRAFHRFDNGWIIQVAREQLDNIHAKLQCTLHVSNGHDTRQDRHTIQITHLNGLRVKRWSYDKLGT
ncbi:hypothetical protein D3C74_435700 [compost metagenome]